MIREGSGTEKSVILVSEWLGSWTLKDKMIFVPNIS